MDLEMFRALLTPAGDDLFTEVGTEYDERTAVALATRLRRLNAPDLVAAALTQVALRRRARAKWGSDAERMFFTRDGFEQATTAAVAAYRAQRINQASPAGGSGPTAAPVADLCCGIGGDLIALARSGCQVTGVDKDPLTVEIARANLAAFDLSDQASVELADVTTFDRSAYGRVIADPARRSARGRVFDPADYSPPWSFVLDLLGGTACVKTAPIIPHRLIPAGVEAEWISEGGEVKEAALWSGALASGAGVRRRATVLVRSDSAGVRVGRGGATLLATPRPVEVWSLTDADDPGAADGGGADGGGVDSGGRDGVGGVPVASPRAYVYEPDGAVIRAGLVTAVAPLIDGALLHPKIAYLTSDQFVATPFATAYRVEEVLPYDLKTIKRALRARDAGTVTVKKRGVDIDPETLRKRLGARGQRAVTLIVTRTDQGAVVLLAEPAHRN
ncbi:THUMP-like domain-containing protein [Actinopolymorpha alba]|uniref:class I SAM-dependent methyltransferase n=1 Tax=Actinopolymorpha alba TaxID=533267 RepID=UPI0007C75E42|nr:methyltransferase domain-containing protein [Actinopolymorpha alba]